MRRVCLREEVGSAINADDLRGRVLSTLNAFAVGSDRLGAALWRLKYGGDYKPATRKAAVVIITHKIHGKAGRQPSARLVLIVEQALREWLHDQCPECRGRKYTGTEYGDPKAERIPCPAGCARDKDTGLFAKKSGLFETVQERMLNKVSCQLCGGRGWRTSVLVDATKTTVCRTCEGAGRKRRSPGARALAVGLDRQAFQKGWAAKYEKALEIMRASDKLTGLTVAQAARAIDGSPGMELMPEGEVDQWLREHSR